MLRLFVPIPSLAFPPLDVTSSLSLMALKSSCTKSPPSELANTKQPINKGRKQKSRLSEAGSGSSLIVDHLSQSVHLIFVKGIHVKCWPKCGPLPTAGTSIPSSWSHSTFDWYCHKMIWYMCKLNLHIVLMGRRDGACVLAMSVLPFISLFSPFKSTIVILFF